MCSFASDFACSHLGSAESSRSHLSRRDNHQTGTLSPQPGIDFSLKAQFRFACLDFSLNYIGGNSWFCRFAHQQNKSTVWHPNVWFIWTDRDRKSQRNLYERIHISLSKISMWTLLPKRLYTLWKNPIRLFFVVDDHVSTYIGGNWCLLFFTNDF